MRWYEFADWLESKLPAINAASDLAGFLTRQFLDFLRGKNMTLTQVSHYMPDGVRAFASLLNMLVEAVAACKVTAKKSTGWDYMGLSVDGKFWVGIELTEPGELQFRTSCKIEREAATNLGVGEVWEENWVPGRNRWGRRVELGSEDVHFFSRSKVSQMQWLEAFLRDCLAKARSIETPNQPPITEQPEEN